MVGEGRICLRKVFDNILLNAFLGLSRRGKLSELRKSSICTPGFLAENWHLYRLWTVSVVLFACTGQISTDDSHATRDVHFESHEPEPRRAANAK